MMRFIFALSGCIAAAMGGFVHPGVLLSAEQLAFVKQQVASQQGPVYEAYLKALKSKSAALDYKPLGPPASLVIECGSYSHPDYGCTWEGEDGTAAYLQALLYLVNGTAAYGANALTILNAYSRVLLYNNTNAPLQSAWGASKWTRAAELMSRAAPPDGPVVWAPADVAAFNAFLYRASLPQYLNGSGANGNWELSQIEAMFGIAVLTENATLFDHAATFWRQRVPAYFYISSDGPKPVPAPRGPTWWFNQLVFNASVDGVAQETCRDLGHLQFGLGAALNAAETALIQGLDLFGEEETRLVAGMEFHAHLLLPNVTAPAYVCNGTGVKTSLEATFVLGYNAFANRRGVPLPQTAAHITNAVLPMPDPEDMFMHIYEPLTHGGNASAAVAAE